LIEAKCERAIVSLGDVAERLRGTPTLSFTHYQPAQPTTVGRRAAGWAYDIHTAIIHWADNFGQNGPRLRGFKGATGTQASYLALFDGDASKVDQFELLAEE